MRPTTMNILILMLSLTVMVAGLYVHVLPVWLAFAWLGSIVIGHYWLHAALQEVVLRLKDVLLAITGKNKERK